MPDETTAQENEEKEEVVEEAPLAPREQCAEIVSRFEEKKDCAGLLYAPLDAQLTYRKTRFCRFKFMGSASALRNFIRKTLVDRVSQDVALDGKPTLGDCRFFLDYGMKKGVLDLEKEAILRYYGELEEPGFEILELELSTRVYVFGEGAPGRAVKRTGKAAKKAGKAGKAVKADQDEEVRAPFIRDIVNPAIHRWSINDERSVA